jgi:hypothetical protein
MLSYQDIGLAAQLMIRKYGAEAEQHAHERARDLAEAGLADAASLWRQVGERIRQSRSRAKYGSRIAQ